MPYFKNICWIFALVFVCLPLSANEKKETNTFSRHAAASPETPEQTTSSISQKFNQVDLKLKNFFEGSKNANDLKMKLLVDSRKQLCIEDFAGCRDISRFVKSLCAADGIRTHRTAEVLWQTHFTFIKTPVDVEQLWWQIQSCSAATTDSQISAALYFYDRYQVFAQEWLTKQTPRTNEALVFHLKTILSLVKKISTNKPFPLNKTKELLLISTSWIPPQKIATLPVSDIDDWLESLGKISMAIGRYDLFEARASQIKFSALVDPAQKEWASIIIERLCFIWQMEGKKQLCTRKFKELRLNAADIDPALRIKIGTAWELFQSGDPLNARKQLAVLLPKASTNLRWGILFRMMLCDLVTGRLESAMTSSKEFTQALSGSPAYPWDKLAGRSIELAILRDQKKFYEAESLAQLMKADLKKQVDGDPEILMWISLDELFVAALQGKKEHAEKLNAEMKVRAGTMVSLVYLTDYAQALVNALNQTSGSSDLDRVRKIFGDKYHYVRWTQAAIEEIKKAQHAIDQKKESL